MLTQFQKQKLPRLFQLHDLDDDGVITRDDFEEYARRIASTRGWNTNSGQAAELRSGFMTFWEGLEAGAHARGAQQVSKEDWFDYWDRILTTPGMYDQVIEPIARLVFTILDHDGDGAVTESEYAETFRKGGLAEADAMPAFARLDQNHDGRLSIAEIQKLLDQYFRSNDPAEPGNAFFGIVKPDIPA